MSPMSPRVDSGQPNESDSLVQLGDSPLRVSRVALGLWPMAGITSLNVDDETSKATVRRAVDLGVNFFDSAFSYGYEGQSDRILADARDQLGLPRDRILIASKVGMMWDAAKNRRLDGRPETLVAHAEECLRRLRTDYVDLMYLHVPDPNVPIEESAGAVARLVDRGLARHAGVSNVDLAQLKRFCTVCRPVALQTYFNAFQQDSVAAVRTFCQENRIAIVCYWVLMKGLLAGHLQRDHVFEPNDRRLTYPVFQGAQWSKAQDLLDLLRREATRMGVTVSQLVIAWTLRQPDVDVALVGAKTPKQIEESTRGSSVELPDELAQSIDAFVAELGFGR